MMKSNQRPGCGMLEDQCVEPKLFLALRYLSSIKEYHEGEENMSFLHETVPVKIDFYNNSNWSLSDFCSFATAAFDAVLTPKIVSSLFVKVLNP